MVSAAFYHPFNEDLYELILEAGVQVAGVGSRTTASLRSYFRFAEPSWQLPSPRDPQLLVPSALQPAVEAARDPALEPILAPT